MWRLDCEDSWVLKNWCFWTVVLEKTLESPLDCKEIQPVHPKGNQSWVFIGRTDVEAETPVLWPPDAKSWLIGKDPDAGKDWGQEEKGTTEDEVGWHYRLNGHGFVWTPEVGDGQGGLACCSSWGCKELDMTERLNWTELMKNIWISHNSLYKLLNMACHLVSSYKHIVDRIHFFVPCLKFYVSTILTQKLALDKFCTTPRLFLIPSYYLPHPWCLRNNS